MREGALLIVGSSTRAAAFSALRGGLTPACVDYFADLDLRSRCQTLACEDYPRDLPALARRLPASPWMYTGAMENHPTVVAEMSRVRPLWGNSPAVLEQVRQPDWLAEWCAAGLCRFPEWRKTADVLPRDGSWLRKAYRSGGGTQVQVLDAQDETSGATADWFYQQRVQGMNASALYVAAGGKARLLGASEQLIGTAWTGASGFRYAGSIGPLDLTAEQQDSLAALGERLAVRAGLAGLFGVDLMISPRRIWVIEVNPRYPASSELLERAGGFSAVAMHVAACRDGQLPPLPHFTGPLLGKVILFARRDAVASPSWVDEAMRSSQSHELFTVADIPPPGTRLRAGWPIMTLLAEAANRDELLEQLQTAADHWLELLYRAD